MRLALAESWIQALDDEQWVVRSFALGVFSREGVISAEAVSRVMARIDRDGWNEAYEFSHQIQDFPHDETSMDWVVERVTKLLQASPAKEDPSLRFLMAWFLDAPSALLKGRIERVSVALEAYQVPGGIPLQLASYTGPQDVSLNPARERLESVAATPESLIEALEETIKCCAEDLEGFPTDDVQRLDILCEALGKSGVIPYETLVGWLEFVLTEDSDEIARAADWRAGAALEILYHGSAPLPLDALLPWLTIDWDWMNERIEKTLRKRGNETDMAAILEVYPSLDWEARLYLTPVIESARYAALEPVIRELARTESAVELKASIAKALVLYGSVESVELAREIQYRKAGHPDMGELKEMLVVHDWLNGNRSSKLVRKIEEMTRRARRLRETMEGYGSITSKLDDDSLASNAFSMASLAVPKAASKSHPTVGRNEPCPCGSGHKFKKCCGG